MKINSRALKIAGIGLLGASSIVTGFIVREQAKTVKTFVEDLKELDNRSKAVIEALESRAQENNEQN